MEPISDAGARFQHAAQWYMNNSFLESISFDGSGATLSVPDKTHPSKPGKKKTTQSGVKPNTFYADSIERIAINIISENFGYSEEEIRANADTVFLELGLDSLDTVEMVMFLEEEFNMVIPDEDLIELFTFNRLIEYIALHKG